MTQTILTTATVLLVGTILAIVTGQPMEVYPVIAVIAVAALVISPVKRVPEGEQ